MSEQCPMRANVWWRKVADFVMDALVDFFVGIGLMHLETEHERLLRERRELEHELEVIKLRQRIGQLRNEIESYKREHS